MSKILIDAGPSERGWHRLEAYLRCPQLYAWGYGSHGDEREREVKASRFPPSEALVRGSLGHVGLAHLYKRLQRSRAPSAADPASAYYSPLEAMEIVSRQWGDIGAEMLPVATAAVKRYAGHYHEEPFEVIGIEEPMETEHHGWRYTARVDLITRDRAGKVWFMDHKFVGRIDGKVHRRYLLSGQFLGLHWLGIRHYGTQFGGVKLNLVGCKNAGFSRSIPEPAPWMLTKFPDVVRHAEEGIREVETLVSLGEPVPASPSEHTCMTSYGECPAFELCRWGASIPFPEGSETMDL